LGLVDQVIKEPLGGAHRDLRGVSNSISQVIEEKLLTFDEIEISDLLDKRYKKIMSYGSI
jgi:acetyl-CoA carboxylase carboxyl transferase subunit alpha